MRIQRLLRMGASEAAGRAWQEAAKWLERSALGGNRFPGGDAHPHPGGAGDLPERFRNGSRGRFFAGAAGAGAAAFLAERMPEGCRQILAAAERMHQGAFDLLGFRGLSFGRPVDWHMDPTSGRRAPAWHWSRIDPLDRDLVGDVKVIWELNRHQWLVRLAQAYRLTGDERHAELVSGHLREWIQANPPGLGVNWASSLELALRLISWCWALALLRTSAALTPELEARVLRGIRAHALHIQRYLSRYSSPNTHLTGEALGLFYAGTLFPDTSGARHWQAAGQAILVEQIERQVHPDGVYLEQSTCYQRYTVEIYLHFLILAARNGLTVPVGVAERVAGMLDFLLAVRRPDGSLPQIGDADGGWLLPLGVRGPDEVGHLFSTAAVLFRRPEYARAAGELAAETVWLLGEEASDLFASLPAGPPSAAALRVFPVGGYAVLRCGPEGGDHQMIFDTGPLGCPWSGGHGHADLLSIQCAAFGEPYLVDPGTFCYAADPAWRDHFRGTAAHSTLRVDARDQAVPAGPFGWRERPQARLRRWVSSARMDLAEADHEAYAGPADPVIHRRRVLFVKPRYWLVVDDLEGAAEHRVEVRFQFAPLPVRFGPAPWVRAHGSRGHGLLVRAFAGIPLTAELEAGKLDPPRGWVSPDYGRREPAPVLVYSGRARAPLRIVTLLLPVADPSEPAPEVAPLGEGAPGPEGLLFERSGETVRIDATEIALERG